ncbi:hypothetical protein [Lactobacillus delbrueckii]|uniref:hypothetical protein n=1 Tax=Lactobacillus delbrueckii TaxID=1584 RepID=UPI00216A252B|nr:hypothetical protein [Lactobacillus delbrueckii]
MTRPVTTWPCWSKALASRLAAGFSYCKGKLPQAQTGKGNALNWAYQQVILDSRDRDHLICGVLDADAYMAEESYQKVIQYFAQDKKWTCSRPG